MDRKGKANVSREKTVSFYSRTPEQTTAIGAELARAWWGHWPETTLVLNLNGPLGAGKTAFVKGVAVGLGLPADLVSSPTFVLANQYAGPEGAWLHHADFYRIEEVSELEEIGLYDMLEPSTVLAVEWGERFLEALPSERIDLSLSSEGDQFRRFEVKASDGWPRKLVSSWASRVEGSR